MPGALKNALDYLFYEWNDKVAAFVCYGSAGGVRAVEHLRVILSELKVAHVRSAVSLSLFDDFQDMSVFTPRDLQTESVSGMLEELEAWTKAMEGVRAA